MKLPNHECVVKVRYGRGFIIRNRERTVGQKHRSDPMQLQPVDHRKLVITAAHCLEQLPPAIAGGTGNSDEIQKDLLGSLDGKIKDIWAECLFADPIGDIAVLGCPDYQLFDDQAEAYRAFVEEAPIVRIGPAKTGPGWVLSLDGRWERSMLEVSTYGGFVSGLWIDPTKDGMSGSPILNDAGFAVALVSVGAETVKDGVRTNQRCGPQPILRRNLPGWLL